MSRRKGKKSNARALVERVAKVELRHHPLRVRLHSETDACCKHLRAVFGKRQLRRAEARASRRRLTATEEASSNPPPHSARTDRPVRRTIRLGRRHQPRAVHIRPRLRRHTTNGDERNEVPQPVCLPRAHQRPQVLKAQLVARRHREAVEPAHIRGEGPCIRKGLLHQRDEVRLRLSRLSAERARRLLEQLAQCWKRSTGAGAGAALPTLRELLEEAARTLGAESAQTEADLVSLVEEAFADAGAFAAYVCRLDRLSMPACDQLRFEHLRALVRSGQAHRLRDLVALVAIGGVPAEARPYVYGARLVAPTKPDGAAHRPISAGTVWRRVAAGFLGRCEAPAARARFGSAQLALAKHGAEVFAACIRLAVQSNPQWVVAKLDFRNAFNECSRVAFLAFAAAHFPVLLLFLCAAYGMPAGPWSP